MADQTITTAIDPQMREAYLGLYDYAKGVAQGLPAQSFAGFTPLYTAGQQAMQAASQQGIGLQNLGMAADLTAAMGSYSPQAVMAAQMNPAAVSQYMNPYQQQVINQSMQDIENARQQAIGQVGQQATAARAFGGSRQGVAESLTNAAYAKQAANTAAQLRSQGFDTAANLMQADIARQQQANLANQAAGLSGAQFRLGAAQQLGALGGAQQAGQYQAAQNLMNLGMTQQQFEQQRLDAQRNLPLQQLGIQQSALGQVPNIGQTQTSPLYQNQGAGALGGALMGGYLGNMLGGAGSNWGIYGALAGGLAGSGLLKF